MVVACAGLGDRVYAEFISTVLCSVAKSSIILPQTVFGLLFPTYSIRLCYVISDINTIVVKSTEVAFYTLVIRAIANSSAHYSSSNSFGVILEYDALRRGHAI